MKVDVDQLWVTPSNLHLRVIVWGDDHAWRHKYYVAVPLDTLEDAVIEGILAFAFNDTPEEDHHQTALF